MEPNKASENQSCLNCESPLSLEAAFCPVCGQKRTTGRVTFKQLLSDFFDNVFNIDSRIFLTLKNLFVPGLLTVEYFRGRHKRYLHPFRLFLVALILMVAAISWLINENISKDGDIMARMSKARVERSLILEIDSLNQLYKEKEGNTRLSVELDSMKQAVYTRNGLKGDSIDLDDYFSILGEDFKPVYIEDAFSLDADELAVKYKIEGVKRKWLLQQKIKVMRDSRSFLRFLIGRISWMGLILIPLLAVSLKLLYWRKNYYYVEHFIFSVHTHTIFFILAALQTVLLLVLPIWTISITASIFAVYLALALHRFYEQNWVKTLLKFFILTMIVYWVLMMLSMMVAVILGVLLF